MSEWIASIITTSAFAALLWIGRKWLITRLTESIKHDYDKNLELLKSQLRQNEEALNFALKTKTLEIEALRNMALSNIMNSQTALNERRITAIEMLWKAVTDLAKLKVSVQVMKSINVEEVEKQSNRKDKNVQAFLDTVGKIAGDINIQDLPKNNAQDARLFVSPYAWSLYSAYSAIVYRAYLQLDLLKRGLETKFLNDEHVLKLVELVLPHQKTNISKYGADASYYLIDEIEELLLKELQNISRGDVYDSENVERANKILEQVNKMRESNVSQSDENSKGPA